MAKRKSQQIKSTADAVRKYAAKKGGKKIVKPKKKKTAQQIAKENEYRKQAERRKNLITKDLGKAEQEQRRIDRAYEAYLVQRNKLIAAGRNVTRQALTKRGFRDAYIRTLDSIIRGDIVASAVKNIQKGLAESEILTTKKQARAAEKAAKDLARRWERDISDGIDEPEQQKAKSVLIDILKGVSYDDILKMGDDALREFTRVAIEYGLKRPGVFHGDDAYGRGYQPWATSVRQVFWEVYYPPAGASTGGNDIFFETLT